MVCAILSLMLSCMSVFVLWWASLVSVILGLIGLITSKDNEAQRIISVAGLVVGLFNFCSMVNIFTIIPRL